MFFFLQTIAEVIRTCLGPNAMLKVREVLCVYAVDKPEATVRQFTLLLYMLILSTLRSKGLGLVCEY